MPRYIQLLVFALIVCCIPMSILLIQNMKNKGMLFYSGTVQEWLDCGNKDATVYTNQRMLEIKNSSARVANSARLVNATIIPPCFIGEKAVIMNSVIGPHVSVGGHSQVLNSVISNSIIGEHAVIRSKVFDNSMVGNHVSLTGHTEQISIGDFTQIQTTEICSWITILKKM